MAKDISKILFTIEDETSWDSVLEQSESKLVVIDIHQEWCGCCEAIHPSISRILLDYDECDSRFLYCAASIGKLGPKLQQFIPTELKIDFVKNGCLPLFAVVRHKVCLNVVVGVDSPTLLLQISQNMPDKPVKE